MLIVVIIRFVVVEVVGAASVSIVVCGCDCGSVVVVDSIGFVVMVGCCSLLLVVVVVMLSSPVVGTAVVCCHGCGCCDFVVVRIVVSCGCGCVVVHLVWCCEILWWCALVPFASSAWVPVF